MAEQTGANLSCLNTTYYNTAHASQIHNEYKREVILTFGKDLLTSWIDANSAQTRRAAQTFYHLEWDRLNLPITTSGGSGIAGANVTLTITSGYIGAGAYSPVQPGYSVYDGTNYYYVVSKDEAVAGAHTITVAPPTAAVAISIASGQQLMVLPTNLVAQGSTVTNNSIRGDGVIFTNTLQAVRRDLCVTDIAALSFSQAVTFWDLPNPLTGRSDTVWTHSEIGRVETEFRNAIELLCLTGQQLTNGTLTALGFNGTTGVIPAITSFGNTVNYTQGVGFQVTDFDSMMVTMEKNQSPSEYMVFPGVELSIQMQKVLKDYFPQGSMVYNTFGGSDQEMMRWGFKGYNFNGRTFYFGKMGVFNNPAWLGVPGFNYIRSAVFMPGSKLMNAAGEEVNYVEKVVLAGNGLEGGYQHYFVDGTGYFGTPVNTTRTCTWTWFSTVGTEVFAAKQLFYAQPAIS